MEYLNVRVAAVFLLLAGVGPFLSGQTSAAAGESDDRYQASVQSHRAAIDFRFRDRILSPLSEPDRLAFKGLNYFAVEPALAMAAWLEPARDTSTFAMPTFDQGTLAYSHYGTIVARLQGREVRLKAFRREQEAFGRNILLVPFRDPTNGEETYSGGRYIEFDLPLADELRLDFNKAMNPLCAYDPGYACPIPPPENHLVIPVRAGEKRFR